MGSPPEPVDEHGQQTDTIGAKNFRRISRKAGTFAANTIACSSVRWSEYRQQRMTFGHASAHRISRRRVKFHSVQTISRGYGRDRSREIRRHRTS
jgi:hypothetical protein